MIPNLLDILKQNLIAFLIMYVVYVDIHQTYPVKQPSIPLGTPIDVPGKAAVMELANGGHSPKFSKYSGVVQWANGFFLWVNLTSSPSESSSDMYYPNKFLEGGKYLTWFGSSVMRPGKYLTLSHRCRLCLYSDEYVFFKIPIVC